MKEIKESCYKWTRILLWDLKRTVINNAVEFLKSEWFVEISIPIIQPQEIFSGKVWEENNNMMFNFKDRWDRDVCLAPEYTAVIQRLAKTYFNSKRDLKVFYVQECFRGERPQKWRYRQFTQLWVEIINPKKDYMDYLISIAVSVLTPLWWEYVVDKDATRWLDYYTWWKWFEISNESLWAQKQVCWGWEYDWWIWFAIWIDRVLETIR